MNKEIEKVETIFDYNPTYEELKRFGGRSSFEFLEKNGIKLCDDDKYYMLGMLFSMRGDKVKACEYWNKITSNEMLMTLWQDF